MHQLQQIFPSLSLFSDLDWNLVTQEYETNYIDLSFPEYLQQKALEGDSPVYLFELAYFEQALFELKSTPPSFPYVPGLHLNPTALFLSLEFDVESMIKNAQTGNIEIIEYPHIKCIFRTVQDELKTIELTEDDIELLQRFEEGPLINVPQAKNLTNLISEGLILKV